MASSADHAELMLIAPEQLSDDDRGSVGL